MQEVRCSQAFPGKFRSACDSQLVSASQHLEREPPSKTTSSKHYTTETTQHITNLSSTPQICRAITPILSCAAKQAASPSAASATSATANVPSATPTCDPPRLCAFATSALSATTRTSASSAAVKESPTLSTASSARDSKRTEMGAQRS
jgi:hypothetical protein